jgi:hypothetical protein
MAFWKKKSEDPWDLDPNRPKKSVAVPAPAEEPERTIPPWVHKPEKPEPISCPWCGEPMEWGNLYAARGGTGGSAFLQWREGEHKGFLDSLRFTGRMVNMGWYEEAWYCEPCGKLVLDAALAMERAGPNYTWEQGKVVFPKEDSEETK